MPNPEDFISSQEAVEILDVHLSTLTRWAESGRISPAYKLPGTNGAFVWLRSEVEQLAAERRQSDVRAASDSSEMAS